MSTFERMRPTESGPGRAVVREAESVRSMRSSIDGQVVAIDAGRGERDRRNSASHRRWPTSSRRSARNPSCWRERRRRVRTGARGERAVGGRRASRCRWRRPRKRGPAWATCAYFGSATTHSPGGAASRRAGGSRSSTASSARRRHLERLTDAILRETRMPAVQIQPCVDDRRPTCRPSPHAVAVALGRFFAG